MCVCVGGRRIFIELLLKVSTNANAALYDHWSVQLSLLALSFADSLQKTIVHGNGRPEVFFSRSATTQRASLLMNPANSFFTDLTHDSHSSPVDAITSFEVTGAALACTSRRRSGR
eukprot:1089691-Amphidinium_carterae.1